MMLEHLDMAIAFVVILLAVSLLVTICVQTVSALVGLRGTNLLWGLKQLLVTVRVDLDDATAQKVAEQVLQHRLISDSSVSRFANAPVIGGLLKRMQYARCVRFDEFVGVMDVIATHAQRDASGRLTDATYQHMADLVAAVRAQASPVPPGVATDMRALAARLSAISMAVVPAGVPSTAGSPLDGAVQELDRLAKAIPAVSDNVKLAKDNLEGWFNTTMDRVSQRFAVHMRIWTVLFSIAIAFALHLDTFHVLAQLAANPDMRAQVASASGALQQVAAARLPQPPAATVTPPAGAAAPAGATAGTGPAGPPAAEHPPQVYVTAMARLAALKGTKPPAAFADRPTAVEWLRSTLAQGGARSDEIDAAVAAYEKDVADHLTTDVDQLSDSALTVRGIVNGTGFQLVPAPYHSWDISPWWPEGITRVNVLHPANLHFWGILFSACLLSLGAPFWYNALKTLSALKPVVAKKDEEEQAQK